VGFHLTEFQVKIVKMFAEGESNTNIAQKLNLSECELETEIKAIYEELKVNNRIHCVIVAYNNGLVFV
jgi:DNA-binding NarL/FixJ family response regulator